MDPFLVNILLVSAITIYISIWIRSVLNILFYNYIHIYMDLFCVNILLVSTITIYISIWIRSVLIFC